MDVRSLIRTLADQGIRLSRSGDRLRVAPRGALTPELRSAIVAHKGALLPLITEPVPTLRPRALGAEAPVSFSQERMWLTQQLDPSGTAYNISVASLIAASGELDRLESAFNEVLARHEVLHTCFAFREGRVVQIPRPPGRVPVRQIVVDDVPAAVRLQTAVERVSEVLNGPYDLASGPLCRLVVASVRSDLHVVAVGMHHIVGDQLSLFVLNEDVRRAYEVPGSVAATPSPPIQYSDFSAWQRECDASGVGARQRRYWIERLEGLPTLDLPLDFQRPPLIQSTGAKVIEPLPDELERAVRDFATQEHVTDFMVFLAAFNVLLHQRTRQSDLGVAVPVSHRTHTWLQDLVGTFVNTVVHRNDLSGNPSFGELVGRVRRTALEALENQDFPFEALLQALEIGRDVSRPPLVQVLFNLVRVPTEPEEGVTVLPLVHVSAQFEIDFNVVLHAPKSAVHFTYNNTLLSASTAASMAKHYVEILRRGVADPDQPLADLIAVEPGEREGILTSGSRFGEPFPKRTLPALIEAAAERAPDRVAVVSNMGSYTYGELLDAAREVTGALRAMGVEPGDRVAMLMERSREMMAALLGIMGAGAAYVPIDPAYPEVRVRYMAEHSAARVLVTHRGLGDRYTLALPTLSLDDGIERKPAPFVPLDAESAAYVIYTSGSTGEPKGVTVPHRAVVNLLTSMAEEPGLEASDRVLAVTTISFDIAVLELYLPLLVGARVILATEAETVDGNELARLLEEHEITLLQATPATWNLLLAVGWEGHADLRALCGGEALSRSLADKLLPRVAELWNMYGPTETTVWSTIDRVAADGPILIGRPIQNTSTYVLGPERDLVPIGVPGELWIGGEGVTHGYFRRPDLTEERFVDSPFRGGERLYRTGDLVRMRPDGRLEHLGRMDHQVKVRGFRIELGEVEAALRGHAAVADAVVVARDDRLVAYLVAAAEEPGTVALRRWVAERLPRYMMPSSFQFLSEFPLTANGKIDRNRLPDPGVTRDPTARARGPEGPRESLVADIWSEVLDIADLRVDDNFFELGGHSLLAMQVVALIETATGARLDPRVLFFWNLGQFAELVPEPEGVE